MEQQELTSEQLTEMLNAEKQRRRDAAVAAIRQALAENRCVLQGIPTFVASGTAYQIAVDFQVVAL